MRKFRSKAITLRNTRRTWNLRHWSCTSKVSKAPKTRLRGKWRGLGIFSMTQPTQSMCKESANTASIQTQLRTTLVFELTPTTCLWEILRLRKRRTIIVSLIWNDSAKTTLKTPTCKAKAELTATKAPRMSKRQTSSVLLFKKKAFRPKKRSQRKLLTYAHSLLGLLCKLRKRKNKK